MVFALPEPSLVLLIGPSGSGKSSFARKHFRETEILSSDYCRALVSDDENDQSATNDAFEILHLILAKRLQRQRTTVIDATNVQQFARRALLAAAACEGISVIAIVFALPEEVCQIRNRQRVHRRVPEFVITQQINELNAWLPGLASEGFHAVITLSSVRDSKIIKLLRNERYS